MKFIPGIQLSLSLSLAPLRLNLNILGFKAINEWKRSHVLTCVALLRGICTCLNYLSDYPPCDCTNFMEAHQTYLRSRTALSLMALWQPMSLELSPVATGNGCMDHGMVLDDWFIHNPRSCKIRISSVSLTQRSCILLFMRSSPAQHTANMQSWPQHVPICHAACSTGIHSFHT